MLFCSGNTIEIIIHFSLQQAILQAGYDAVDAVRNSVPRSWWDYFRNMMGAGVALVTRGMRNQSTAPAAVAPPNVRVMPTWFRHTAHHKSVLLVVFVAAGVGCSVYYWWRRRPR